MELCIKTIHIFDEFFIPNGFNPCFNGTMYKNGNIFLPEVIRNVVSILVLMELCIKTKAIGSKVSQETSFNPCFNGTMYKN